MSGRSFAWPIRENCKPTLKSLVYPGVSTCHNLLPSAFGIFLIFFFCENDVLTEKKNQKDTKCPGNEVVRVSNPGASGFHF